MKNSLVIPAGGAAGRASKANAKQCSTFSDRNDFLKKMKKNSEAVQTVYWIFLCLTFDLRQEVSFSC